MKLSEKTKKWLIVTLLGILCVVLIIAIASRIMREEPEVAMIPITPAVTEKITPEISESALTTTPAPTLTPTPKVSVQPIEPTVTTVPPKDTGDSEGNAQSIQAEVTKPAEPAEEVKADPTKKPDGKKVTPVEKDKGTKKNNDTSSSSSTPKSGDKNEKGQIWVPGFGWVDDSGDNVGNEADDMYENGNKIGNMD